MDERLLTPELRSQLARSAALIKAAKYDGREATAKARAAAEGRFERQVDPNGELPTDERARRAEAARRAHFVGMAAKSAIARRRARYLSALADAVDDEILADE